MNVQTMILTLQSFWAKQNCIILNAYDTEKGAGTMSPHTLLRTIGPEPWNVAYVEPSRRPEDGRYGENPNRLYQHHQFQVIMKPSPINIQELYLDSLRALGIDPLKHDIRFVEDNWENPTLGCAGLGWEVWLDGMEITQFTYFQQVGGMEQTRFLLKSHMALNVSRRIFKTKKMYLSSSGSKVLAMVIYSCNLNMNTPPTRLKYRIQICCFLYLQHTKRKLVEHLNAI